MQAGRPNKLARLVGTRGFTMIRRVFLAFLLFGVVGCGGVDLPDPANVAGSYVLQTVDGGSLPWEYGAVKDEITAGLVILNADMSCSRRVTSETTDGRKVTPTEVCTYTMKFEAITLTFQPNGNTTSGSIIGSSLTLQSASGFVFIYRR